jgi:hypothetical protein
LTKANNSLIQTFKAQEPQNLQQKMLSPQNSQANNYYKHRGHLSVRTTKGQQRVQHQVIRIILSSN